MGGWWWWGVGCACHNLFCLRAAADEVGPGAGAADPGWALSSYPGFINTEQLFCLFCAGPSRNRNRYRAKRNDLGGVRDLGGTGKKKRQMAEGMGAVQPEGSIVEDRQVGDQTLEPIRRTTQTFFALHGKIIIKTMLEIWMMI